MRKAIARLSARPRLPVTESKINAPPIGFTIENNAGKASRNAPMAVATGIGLKSMARYGDL